MKANTTGNNQRSGNNAVGNKQQGIFIGKVKENTDPSGLGRLRVWIPQLSAAKETDKSSWHTVRYCPPFAGAGDTKAEATANDATKYRQTNQSYGVWMVPPDLNVQVICSFINGELHQGVWWACLPMDGHTHALPGIASGSTHDGKVLPVAERNRYNTADPQNEHRPEHIVGDVIKGQGLEKDRQRGHTNAGPFRNKEKHPGLAYGILTPGQHQFVMDDGPDGRSGQIRLRTQSGNSIIMDNNCGFIYVINANGSAWVQLDKAGNIDMYAMGDFSINAEGSINLRAGNNINLDASENINAGAAKNFNLEACEVFNATGTNGMKLSTGQNMNILADSQFKMTGQRIDLNGPPAERAELPAQNSLVTNAVVGTSIAGRVPEAEPYGGHNCRNEGEQPTVAPGSPGVPDAEITPSPDSYKEDPTVADPENPTPEETNAIACLADVTLTKLSDEAFNLMKSREAYRGMMYADYQGYSIGYGTRVDIFGPSNPASKIDDNLKQALLAGPSEAEARLASRQIIDRHVSPAIINLIKKESTGKNVCLTQSHVDALIMAAYGNPSQANEMARKLVASGASQADGKPRKEDIASIWANSKYSNSANQRNSEAKFAMTGKPNSDSRSLTGSQLLTQGVKADETAVRNNKARNPQNPWAGSLGNGPQTGTKTDTAYGKPTAQQLGQWERSAYLNTGKAPIGSNLTLIQLRDKYGPPHIDGNYPPRMPAPALQG